jgi:adenosine kinase
MANYVDECHAAGIPFMYDPSHQVARLDGDSLKHGIDRCQILICNEYEFEIIMQKTGYSREALIEMVPVLIVTLGENGAAIHDEGQVITVPIFPVSEIKDPTGVGDAFRGGLLRGMAAGWSWTLCGQIGALCATYVLENNGTQTHRYSAAEFVERFRTVFDDQGALDELLG